MPTTTTTAKSRGQYTESDLTLKAANGIIKREIRDKPTTHNIVSKAYAEYSEKRDRLEINSRKQAALIAQLRTGHHKGLAYYENFVEPLQSDKCKRCDDNKVDTVKHWFTECAQTLEARQRIFGSTELELQELGASPGKVLKLAEKTLC